LFFVLYSLHLLIVNSRFIISASILHTSLYSLFFLISILLVLSSCPGRHESCWIVLRPGTTDCASYLPM